MLAALCKRDIRSLIIAKHKRKLYSKIQSMNFGNRFLSYAEKLIHLLKRGDSQRHGFQNLTGLLGKNQVGG